MPFIKISFLFILVGWALIASRISSADTLSFNTTSSPPLSTPDQDGYEDRLIIEALRRVGHDVKISFLPGERSLMNLNNGVDDGTHVRIAGIESTYRNIIPVSEKITNWHFVAFTRRTDIKIEKFSDLEPYDVAFMNGWKIFENDVSKARSITKANKPEQLFRLLGRGRTDVILYERWSGRKLARDLGMEEVREVSPPLAVKEMFIYLHKRHKGIVGELGRALKKMKSDGTYEKIFQVTLAPLKQD